MEINLNEIRGNSLVRYGFRVLLAKEFGLYLKEQEVEKILLAESCIEVYEDVEEFLEKSGWRRDNPELCSECYLFENHICRKIQGKIWYFSRIQYENGLRGMKQGFKKMPENRRDDMCTKNELNSILQKLTQIYRSVYGENLVQVILYGSYARGDYHTDSDVDVVAIVHGDRKTLQQQLKKVWDSSCELELEYDTILSPTVIPYEEFKQYQTVLPYYRNISQEGVVISA